MMRNDSRVGIEKKFDFGILRTKFRLIRRIMKSNFIVCVFCINSDDESFDIATSIVGFAKTADSMITSMACAQLPGNIKNTMVDGLIDKGMVREAVVLNKEWSKHIKTCSENPETNFHEMFEKIMNSRSSKSLRKLIETIDMKLNSQED